MLILEVRSKERRVVVLQEARTYLLSTTILGLVYMVTHDPNIINCLLPFKTAGHQINIYNVSTKCQAGSLGWRYEKLVNVIEDFFGNSPGYTVI